VYKALLCWRYLRTRFIALPSVISVMLGVATIIIVNSVMGGFAREMRSRIRGAHADVMISARGSDGFAGYEQIMQRIGDDPQLKPHIVKMSRVITAYGMVNCTIPGYERPRELPDGRLVLEERTEYDAQGNPKQVMRPVWDVEAFSKEVYLLGVDPVEESVIGRLGEWVHKGRDVLAAASADKTVGPLDRRWDPRRPPLAALRPEDANGPPSFEVRPATAAWRKEYYTRLRDCYYNKFNETTGELVKPTGIIMGSLLVSRRRDKQDHFLLWPGMDVTIVTFVTEAHLQDDPRAVETFTIADTVKSGMSDYDGHYIYMPFEKLQAMRNMQGRATAIHVRLTDYAHAKAVVKRLEEMLDEMGRGREFVVGTWEDKNTPILSAVAIETAILNIMLFFIIAVAGFGILAIFAMIVVEKTRDIGIIKALGGGNRGVMGLFLGYGLALGAVGSGLGLLIAILFISNLDAIEELIAKLSGVEVFDRNIYYFEHIPRTSDPWMMAWVVGGAMLIALLASVWPAWRAARLDPVESLRHE